MGRRARWLYGTTGFMAWLLKRGLPEGRPIIFMWPNIGRPKAWHGSIGTISRNADQAAVPPARCRLPQRDKAPVACSIAPTRTLLEDRLSKSLSLKTTFSET